MQHLKDTGMSYFSHLLRAWKIAGILIVHGVFPDIWQTKASSMIHNDTSTRKHLLKHLGVIK